MISVPYILKNILFLGPLITGGAMAIHSKKDVLKYMTLLYTVAFGLFILYTLYFQLNTSSKRAKLISTYLRFYGKPKDTPVNSYSDNRVFLSIFFMPGLLADKFLFPPNIYLYYTMLFVFGAGAIASTYYAIELNNYEIEQDSSNNFFIKKNKNLIYLLAIPILIIVMGIFYISDKAIF